MTTQTKAFHEIMQILPTLTKKELRVVLAGIDHLQSKEAEAGQLYHAVVTVLGSRMPFQQFKKRRQLYKEWREDEPAIIHFVNANWGELKDVEMLGLLKYLVKMLVDEMQRKGRAVSLFNVVRQLHDIPMVFDRQFPGYKEAGLCGSILTAMSLAK